MSFPFLWKEGNGNELTSEYFQALLSQYSGFATCVVFMGGEWHREELVAHLKYAQQQGYRTCLYTGEDNVPFNILGHLTWIKTGKWDKDLGGLESHTTNQVFKEVKTNKKLNHLFTSK